MKIAVIGGGYVGLVVSACLAKKGHEITCFDISRDSVDDLATGKLTIYEPGLDALVAEMMAAKLLFFQWSFLIESPSKAFDLYIICVGTPPLIDGRLNCDAVHDAVDDIAFAYPSAAVAIKSTLMPGTCREIKKRHPDLRLMAWPEKLRQGSAIEDFDKEAVVVGTSDFSDIAWMPVVANIVVNYEDAELSKLALNGYLAGRISYVNMLAGICEKIGADITVVQRLLSLDQRVGGPLFAGPGYGGSCFPKDLHALSTLPHKNEGTLLAAIAEANDEAKRWPIDKLVDLGLHKPGAGPIAMWGLTFKAGTSDLRESPAVEVAHKILSIGTNHLRVYDPSPMAMARFDPQFKQSPRCSLTKGNDALHCAARCKALVVMTEWSDFRTADMGLIKGVMLPDPVLLDCRNLYDPNEMRALGFRYFGVGRP